MDSSTTEISMQEVNKHNKKDDAWIVIDGKVYDITKFAELHPGGAAIMQHYAGKDATKEFQYLKHSDHAKTMLSSLYIADVKDYDQEQSQQNNQTAFSEPTNQQNGKKNLIIIGAGICGVSTAYFLSEQLKGDMNITVVEKSPLVGGTGLKSSAIMWIGPLLEKADSQEVKVSLTDWLGHTSYDFLKKMEKEWEEVEFQERGTIGVIQSDKELEYIQKLFGKGGRLDGKGRLLNQQEMLQIEPALNPELKGALWHEKGATVDPFLVCNALANRAKQNGVKFIHEQEVTNLEKNDKGFNLTCKNSKGLEEVHSTENIVITVGWQGKQLSQFLNHEVPVAGMHGQMLAIKNKNVKLNNNVYSWEALTYWQNHKMKHHFTLESDQPHSRLTRHFYGLQIKNGVCKFGGDRILTDLNGKVIEQGIEETKKQLAEIIPAFKNSYVIGSWSGTMPFTPDQKIILGELEKGLYIITGSGFMRGVGTGMLLSEVILGNKQNDNYIKECSPHRFEKQKQQVKN